MLPFFQNLLESSMTAGDSSDSVEVAPNPVRFSEFLETFPPNRRAEIVPLLETYFTTDSAGNTTGKQGLKFSHIDLHCPNAKCGGLRSFRCIMSGAPITTTGVHNFYLVYTCANCQRSTKTFAVAVQRTESLNGVAMKYGEEPAFGPPTPARLISMIGDYRELFLKGRRCENQGLGIAAFTYYRRVVENQKAKILGEIARVAQRIGASQETINTLKNSAEEKQFSRALNMAKAALPQSLLIDGHNPLGLLHNALSDGMHARTDAECLAIATSVRVVLAELSERVSQALKDEAELKRALTTLMKTTEKQ